MVIADRIKKLGTETAFAVSAEAAAHTARGRKVYPFHLGDMNIKTPDNIIEATVKAMREGKTGYCSNYGIAPLREALAQDINRTHKTSYTMENVAIQPGGKPVISKFFLALMNPGDEVLYPNPGYPIYESQIEFHGGVAVPYTLVEGAENFELNIAAIEEKITDRTKLLVFNNCQNPTGAESSPAEMERVAELVRKHDLIVLADEAYFDLRYEGQTQSLAELPGMQERCVILYTFAKRFAMTGWRLGAAIGPREIVDVIAKLNVNDESCSTHFTQFGAIEGLAGDQSGHEAIIRTLRGRRDLCVRMLNDIDGVRCFKPDATFYLFPNVTGAMERLGYTNYEKFRRDVLDATGVSFCTRLHFGRAYPDETNRYIRFAYSGIDEELIEEGLGSLKAFLER